MADALQPITSGVMRTLQELVSGFLPLSARDLKREIADRLARIPNRINDYGYDAYGFSPKWMQSMAVPGVLLYRHYFRSVCFDIDRLPPGRMLLVANHAGQLPIDAAMISTALLMEADPPRIARGMAEYFIPRLPWLNVALTRSGSLVGTPENCIHMLENEECVMVFPEGVRGINKPFYKRYQLQRFGLGFMRLALETGTPIVPVGVVGSEEQQPGLANLEGLGRMLGMPAFPITIGFPWLGPLGLLPLPVKYRLYFGKPLLFEGDAHDDDRVIEARVEQVKQALSALLERGRRERTGIFTG
ncbi:MAG: acyltransferase family protein [Myxococcales bacterium]|nr:acyltransferase family protein [Myxococcales bacterium]